MGIDPDPTECRVERAGFSQGPRNPGPAPRRHLCTRRQERDGTSPAGKAQIQTRVSLEDLAEDYGRDGDGGLQGEPQDDVELKALELRIRRGAIDTARGRMHEDRDVQIATSCVESVHLRAVQLKWKLGTTPGAYQPELCRSPLQFPRGIIRALHWHRSQTQQSTRVPLNKLCKGVVVLLAEAHCIAQGDVVEVRQGVGGEDLQVDAASIHTCNPHLRIHERASLVFDPAQIVLADAIEGLPCFFSDLRPIASSSA
mmetsp:Transcript_43943/g.116129  ORF Transcript_43943/g.116129 Transcript_43943/m.116129 type:complete len:256 (+) Transcript_43943:707-1474(+)